MISGRTSQAVRQQQLLAKKLEELTGKAKFAIAEGRDDLAEAALSRQIDFEAQVAKLVDVEAQAREEEGKLEDGLTALQSRKSQMEDALSAYMSSRRDAALGGDGAVHPQRSAERKVEVAEQAFDRAMTGAGGVGFTRADADTINKVAEIDGMQKGANVAERLALLKAQKAA